MNCRFCRSGAEETQEHLEICTGNEQERRKLPNISTDCDQLLRFWIRMTKKLSNYSEKNQSNSNNSIVISNNPVIDSNSASNINDDNIVQSYSSSDSLGSLISLVSCDGHAPSLISWYEIADSYKYKLDFNWHESFEMSLIVKIIN